MKYDNVTYQKQDRKLKNSEILPVCVIQAYGGSGNIAQFKGYSSIQSKP